MIRIENISFGYNKTADLFDALNLQLSAGSVCGLLGKNGAGKTTLLKIMAGLLFAQTGSCMRGNDDAKKRIPTSLEDIYFVPEEFFVPQLIAKNYLNLYAPFYPCFDQALFQACMREFDIADNKLLTTLSHGQQKKFLISFALATQCKIILFDEPTNGLDIPSKSQFRKLIASNMTDEKLFIISTHQVHDVEKLVDNVVILDSGKIIVNTSMANVMKTIAIEQESAEPSLSSCLYFEKNIAGYSVITENKSGIETSIDLELFFNMVIANKDQLRKLFKEGK